MTTRTFIFGLGLGVCVTCLLFTAMSNLDDVGRRTFAQPGEPRFVRGVRECRRASGPIRIDGRADEDAWKTAQVVDEFSPFWLGRPALTETTARLLWDDDYLYFHAAMQDADVFASVTEHDGSTWVNDVFELFVRPSESSLNYYEFEVNAANAVFDTFFPSRGGGGVERWRRAHEFHVETAVVVKGTLNRWQDDDDGWTVEGRIPWSDFSHTGGKPKAGDTWRFALCRYDYSKNFDEPEVSSCASLRRGNFHWYEDYDDLRFVSRQRP